MSILPKVLTLLGTRPEIIRLSVLIKKLDAVSEQVLVNTMQNFTESLNSAFFSELGIREPDYSMDTDSRSFHHGLADMIRQFGEILDIENPDVLVVLGDTNTALISVLAKRRKIAVYHLEAGNRSFDENVPEEINRRLVDSFADFNLCYSKRAVDHLFREGHQHRRVALVGSPIPEIVHHYAANIASSKILDELKLQEQRFIVASFHRQENVDNQGRLNLILEALSKVAKEFDVGVVVSTHPRTRSHLEKVEGIGGYVQDGLRFLDPLGYFDYVRLQKEAFCVVSDSGSISEEAAVLQIKAVTIRDSMERPEALDAGTLVMSGLQPDSLVDAIRLTAASQVVGNPTDYQSSDFSERVAKFIFSTWHLNRKWHGYH